MFTLTELLRGMEVVAAFGAGAALALVAGLVHLARRFRPARVRRLAADERGLSYTFSYVLTIPVYLFFLCTAYEATFLMIGKIGTMYAAHAGARSAAVWHSAVADSGDPDEPVREDRIGQSVATAMAPFATTYWGHLTSVPSGKAAVWAGEYSLATTMYAPDDAPARRRPYEQTGPNTGSLFTRVMVAASRTTYEYEVDGSKPDGAIRFTVKYQAPLRIPGPARWLNGGGRSYEITSHATLPNERPDTADRTIGIDYHSAGRRRR